MTPKIEENTWIFEVFFPPIFYRMVKKIKQYKRAVLETNNFPAHLFPLLA